MLYFMYSCNQWWILGEANETVASGLPFLGAPSILGTPFENSAYSFSFLCIIVRDHDEGGTKSGKYKIDSK